jgi:hypothetical protein
MEGKSGFPGKYLTVANYHWTVWGIGGGYSLHIEGNTG